MGWRELVSEAGAVLCQNNLSSSYLTPSISHSPQ